MPTLYCYVDEDTLRLLREASAETGRKVEELAEAAISEATVQYKNSRPRREPGYTQYTSYRP